MLKQILINISKGINHSIIIALNIIIIFKSIKKEVYLPKIEELKIIMKRVMSKIDYITSIFEIEITDNKYIDYIDAAMNNITNINRALDFVDDNLPNN